MINKAIIYATNVHRGQFRKGSNTPYILHTLEAGIIASQLTDKEEVIAAAILHDTIEDGDNITAADLVEAFGDRVAELVVCESEDKSKTWKERKTATHVQLENTEDEAELILVLADKLSNIRSVARDYKAIGDELWQRFNEKDMKQHAWYYRGIADRLTRLDWSEAYGEYIELVEEVFGDNAQ